VPTVGHNAHVDDDDLVLADPWIDLRGGGVDEEAERRRLADELRDEVAPGHLLFGVDVIAIGRSTANDDVLFQLPCKRWAIVHLTGTRPDRPPWPSTRIFDSLDEVEAATVADS
jgi:hypothetical protein